jgi:exonuclease III
VSGCSIVSSEKKVYKRNDEVSNGYLRILFWNCHGISNLYNIDAVERQAIEKYSVIGLSETWERKTLNKLSCFSDYNIVQKEAVKINEQGRAIGGLLLLIKSNLRFSVLEINDSFIFVNIKVQNSSIIIGQIYLRSGHEAEGMNKLDVFLDRNIGIINSTPVIMGGDYNARVGDLNTTTDDDYFRCSSLTTSRDSCDKFVDKKGKKLVELMEKYLFYLVNGRSASDMPGKFTFFNQNGTSTIDYIWINFNFINIVNDMQVCDFILHSDHLPIAVCTILPTDRDDKRINKDNCPIIQKLVWSKESEMVFKNALRISDRLQFDNTYSIEQLFDNFITAIKESAQLSNMVKNNSGETVFKNKPWYDLNCNIKKRNVRKLYRLAKKHSFAKEFLLRYLEEKKSYRWTLISKRSAFYDLLRSMLTNVKNSKEFWKVVRFFKNNQFEKDTIEMEEWVSFLENKYSECVGEIISFSDARHCFLDNDFTLSEIKNVIANLKSNKAPGCDTVKNEFYKALPEIGIEYLLNIFNKVMEEERLPREWSRIKMYFLYKKGERSNPKNYRGIALLNTVVKIFTRLIEMRLRHWAEICNLLPESQSGFRRERSCVDNIFVLHTMIFHQVMVKRKELYGLFVDFEAAFDSVPQSLLWYRLGTSGVSSKTIRLLANLYSGAELVVEKGNATSKPIRVAKGVLQGDSISPLLFSLYIRDMELFFREKGLHGVTVDGSHDILMLLFADDIIILADCKADLRNKLKCLANYCDKWKLTVNTQKTKIVPFHKGGLKVKQGFFYNTETIEIVNKYRYLGVDFYASGRFGKFAESQLNKVKGVSESVIGILGRAKSDNWDSKMKLYDTVVIPSFLYGAEVWALGCLDIVEKGQLYFLKRILLLSKATPSFMVRLELKRIKLNNLIFRRCIN